jgi:hypothetical protein
MFLIGQLHLLPSIQFSTVAPDHDTVICPKPWIVMQYKAFELAIRFNATLRVWSIKKVGTS